MRVTDQDKIRLRAFQIWEAEGRPEGRELEHWHRAEAELSLVPLPRRMKTADGEMPGKPVKKPSVAAKTAAVKAAPEKPRKAAPKGK